MDLPERQADVVCRDQQVKSLLSLLGDPNAAVPPCIFVCGDKSSGKSHTLNKVLSALNVNHAIFNCVESYSPYLMYDSILSQLLGSSSFTSRTKCDDFMDFLAKLKTAFDEGHFHDRTVIVLEGSERLRDMNHNLLPAFTRLQELSCLKRVCVVLVSHILWDKFSPSDGLPPPIEIFFHQYSQSDIIKILSLEMPENYPADFYHNYLQLFVAVFLRTCRDVSELKYKAAENFSKYCEPVDRGEIDMHDSNKLWKHISPFFKASLQTTYMRFETGNTLDAESESVRSLDKHNSLSSSAKFALSFELPYYAKYLIIAAFLASYNSPKEDKKLFVKLSGKTKKRVPKNMKTSHAKISALVLGPRQFDLERLLAIFYSIIEEKPHISANLLTQISSLIELQLLKVGNDALEVPKYKCAVGLDFIITIARTLSFNVTKYLVDYK